MRYALAVPNSARLAATAQSWDSDVGGTEIAIAMRLADELGFHKVRLAEHLLVPRAHAALSGDHYLAVTTALGFVAGVTNRIELASGVTLLPLHHPAAFAKMWATLDWLSGGRAVPTIGVGWLKEEFDLLGVDFARRGRLCDEYLEAIVELWNGEHPGFSGPVARAEDVGVSPRPIQRPMPLWFGGDAGGMLNRIARWGDGWAPFLTPPEQIAAKLDYIRSRPDYHGRPIAVQYALSRMAMTQGHVPTNDPAALASWDAQREIDRISWMASLGITEVVLTRPPLRDFAHYLDWLRWLAAEVMPKAPQILPRGL